MHGQDLNAINGGQVDTGQVVQFSAQVEGRFMLSFDAGPGAGRQRWSRARSWRRDGLVHRGGFHVTGDNLLVEEVVGGQRLAQGEEMFPLVVAGQGGGDLGLALAAVRIAMGCR